MNHDNNFTILRIFAAGLVIWAHAYDLTGSSEVDLLKELTGKTFGWAAVTVFFVVSGCLITQSLMRNPNVVRYFAARALRIYPGLIVCILVTTVSLGIFVSSVSLRQFAFSPTTIHYVVGNATLLHINYHLPGVFASNPYPDAVNGSLWTLKKEIGCYMAAACLLVVPLKRRQFAVIILLVPFLAYYAADLDKWRGAENETIKLGLAFLVGAIYATFEHKIKAWHVLVTTILAAMLLDTRFATPALIFALAAFALWFAYAPTPGLHRISRTTPDWSYGIYIYAFPIQQLVAMTMPDLQVHTHFLVAFALTLIPAGLSWHLVEKPALSLKDSWFSRRRLEAA